MKRLLTYGLLLLTILASHFVVSACQDDLPETTEVMMTFTTRAVTQGAASTAPDKERMKDLHVIMLRSDGTIVGNHTEPNITASSVTFTFSTPIKTTGEDFTFLAIANENNIGKTLVNDNLKIGDELSTGDIENLTMDADLNDEIDALPQTKLWTVYVPQTQNHKVNQTLDFVGSKISVVFNNMTKEPQSLRDISITGITPNTQGYLFKQDGTDYIDSKDNNATPISWDKVLMLAAPTTGANDETIYASDSVAYYTYPLGEGNISSPMLYADWNGEQRELSLNRIKDKEGNEIDFTSLKRNEHLRIEITLTPAGDITVNYTIAAWEETPTNIGDKAPTTPENGYHVDTWGTGGIIDVGGGGNDVWQLGNGQTITGKQEWQFEKTDFEVSDYIPLGVPKEYIAAGNTLIAYFKCKEKSESDTYQKIKVQYDTGWANYSLGDDFVTYDYDLNKEYIRSLTLTQEMIDIGDGYNNLTNMNLILRVRDENGVPRHIVVSKLILVTPSSQAAQ